MKNAEVVMLVRETVVAAISSALKEQDARFDQKLCDFRLDIRDEIHSCIAASEVRTMKKLDELRTEMHTIKEEIIDGITDVLDESVLPQIVDLRTDVDRITVRLQMA